MGLLGLELGQVLVVGRLVAREVECCRVMLVLGDGG